VGVVSAWWWSWLLTAVGVTGFVLAGRKVWWAWYVNIACQFLWLAYALITEQYGFIVASGVYFVVFTRNAVRWTREQFAKPCWSCGEVIPGTCGCDPELKGAAGERQRQIEHFKECDCHDSWDQCPCADGGHPADRPCGCCPLGTGLCG
jgi:hypothetical protein